MKRDDLGKMLSATLLLDSADGAKEEYDTVCGCDMMSELLASMNRNGDDGGIKHNGQGSSGVVLLTNLTNPQVVRTSEMVDIKLVILLRGKRPAPETIALAEACGISIMTTPHTMFSSCGILYQEKLLDLIQLQKNDV